MPQPHYEYKFLQVIGEGSYGKVYKAIHLASGRVLAIKVLNCSDDFNQKIKNQLVIMLECSSQHVVRCYGSQLVAGSVWIVMEYCNRGSVFDLIREYKLTQFQLATILKSVLLGLDYLHTRKKVHRDVKAANILLDDNGIAKLGDFGVAGELMSTYGDKDTFIGSPFWMSPEILSKSRYNSKTDIWSLGITAIQMAEGQAPFTNMHPFRAMFAIQRTPPKGLNKPELFSPQFARFVKRCLTYNPEERPSAKQLLSDPFILHYARGRIDFDLLVFKEQGTEEAATTNASGTIIEYMNAQQENGPIIWQPMQPAEGLETMVVKQQEGSQHEPDFIRYIKENSKRLASNNKENQEVNFQKTTFRKELDSELERQIEQLKRERDLQIKEIKERYSAKIEALESRVELQVKQRQRQRQRQGKDRGQGVREKGEKGRVRLTIAKPKFKFK